MEWAFNSYYTLIAATIVLLVGKLMVTRIKFLQNFNIPEPVAGGLLAALILFALHYFYGASFKFEKSLQDAFMLMFFTSIGLSADFSRLRAGGEFAVDEMLDLLHTCLPVARCNWRWIGAQDGRGQPPCAILRRRVQLTTVRKVSCSLRCT